MSGTDGIPISVREVESLWIELSHIKQAKSLKLRSNLVFTVTHRNFADFAFQGAEKTQRNLTFPMLSMMIKKLQIGESYDDFEIFISSELKKWISYGTVQSEAHK